MKTLKKHSQIPVFMTLQKENQSNVLTRRKNPKRNPRIIDSKDTNIQYSEDLFWFLFLLMEEFGGSILGILTYGNAEYK